MEFTSTFDQFTDELAERLQLAQRIGMSDKQAVDTATRIGDWLASDVEPRSPEQRLLREMWTQGDEREQRAIASTLVKMLQNRKAH